MLEPVEDGEGLLPQDLVTRRNRLWFRGTRQTAATTSTAGLSPGVWVTRHRVDGQEGHGRLSLSVSREEKFGVLGTRAE